MATALPRTRPALLALLNPRPLPLLPASRSSTSPQPSSSSTSTTPICSAPKSARFLTTSTPRAVVMPKDAPNMRLAQRDGQSALRAPVVNPADRYESKTDDLHRYGAWVMGCLPKFVQQISVWKDELTIYICPSGVIPVFSFLKYNSSAEFTQVSTVTAADYPSRRYRFEVVYHLLSVRYNARIRVKTYADEASPVPSITSLYDGANWYEREVYDLYGVFFVGHPDLRRILTDYGFEGHPLRKDFPLTGYTEVRYDEEKKRIVTEPLELTQAFRNFEGGSSAWEQVGAGLDKKPESFKLPKPKPEEEKDEAKK